jgi:hypothetical protein
MVHRADERQSSDSNVARRSGISIPLVSTSRYLQDLRPAGATVRTVLPADLQ